MKKILQICDVEGWAIDRLASAIVKHNPQFEWKRIFAHPRDLDKDAVDLKPICEAIEWADAIDVQYWRVLHLLSQKIPEIKEKVIMLTHHNEKNLLSENWDYVDIHIAKTEWSKRRLLEAGYKDVRYIANSFDPEVFQWNPAYPPAEVSIGFAGRVVRWKGIKEIAKAARELGVPFKIMGKQEDGEYLAEFAEEDFANIDWSFFNYPDEHISDFYQNISVYVCNSEPEREVGPLGVIEAMACGVPVVSTPCGIVKDIAKDRENVIIAPFGNYESLRDSIKEVLDSVQLANNLREGGWKTIRSHSDWVMAIEYSRVLYDLLGLQDNPFDKYPWVSVVIPATFDRASYVKQILEGLDKQGYPNIEAVVVWDELGDSWKDKQDIGTHNFPIKELNTNQVGYNLAMARNIGTIEAGGELIVYCDSRFIPQPGAISEFVNRMNDHRPEDKVWLFGAKVSKGIKSHKQSFVENWSCIRRQQIIDAGMFNERVNQYGGMSQELRSRFLAQKFELLYCDTVLADEIAKSNSRGLDRRKESIHMKALMAKLNFSK